MAPEKYIAFISYRHRENTQRVSAMLRKRLEGYHLPAGLPPARNRRVFRDTDELPTSSDLGADIENALKDSGWLICLCTEEYTASRWCMREVDEYLAMGRKDRILPVLVSGDPEVSVPAQIRDIPPAADIRGTESHALRKRVEAAVPVLLGRMAGCSPEEAAACERKYRWGMGSAVAAAVTAALLGFAFYATDAAARIERNNGQIRAASQQADAARDEALKERNEALAKNASYYSRLAWNAIGEGKDEEAIALAMSVLPEDLHGDEPVPADAVGALRVALNMPSRPKESFILGRSTETGYTVTGWAEDSSSGERIILLTGEQGTAEKYMEYDTGVLGERDRGYLQKAQEKGYSSLYIAKSGSPNHSVYYGPEKQLYIHGNSGSEGEDRYITLNGKPLYADRVLELGTYRMLAWLENPAPGQEARAAVVDMTQSAAVELPELAENPVSASLSSGSRRLAVVDGKQQLALYDADTGEKKAAIAGRWSWVYYPYASSRLCAIDADGKAWLYNTVTLEPEYRFESPSAVRSILYCSMKGYFLACCEDGFRIYGRNGELLQEIPSGDPPLFAVWSRWDSIAYLHLGTSFVAGYPDRVDTYVLDSEADPEVTDYIPLYRKGVAEETSTRTAVYSPDGRYVYLAHGNRELTKWSVSDGELIWACPEKGKDHSGVTVDLYLSRDGKAIWRTSRDGKGMQKVDAGTGEVLLELTCSTAGGLQESPDGKTILTGGGCIDAETGGVVWAKQFAAYCMYSEDGREIRCFRNDAQEDGTKSIRMYRVDTETGECTEECTLVELRSGEAPEGFFDLSTDPESMQLLIQYYEKSEDESIETRICAFHIPEEKPFAEETLNGPKFTVAFSCTGTPVLKWKDRAEGVDFCRPVLPDGRIGEPVDADTPEGRILNTTRAAYGIFAGDEVARKGAVLTRISDGAVVMESTLHDGIAVAPDGSSVCLYAYYQNPAVIHASDADSLVKKARMRMGGNKE